MKVLPTMGSSYSGSLRGITASHNKGGLYFRGRTIPTNPASSYQTAVRNVFGALSQVWSDTLTQMQRDGWDTYAAAVSWVDSLGQNIQLSGVNHYVRANTPRLQADAMLGTSLGRIDTAPAVQELGVAPSVNSALLANDVGPPNEISTQVEWNNDASYTSSDKILLFLGAPRNEGIKFFKGPYILCGTEGGDASNITFELFDDTPTASPYSDRFGQPGVGQRIFGYLRATMADGRLSQKVPFDAGVIPTAS